MLAVYRKNNANAGRRKNARGKQRQHRQLGTARNERQQQHGQAAAAGIRHGAGGHHSRNRASETQQQRRERTAGKADAAKRTVGNEGGARHITAVLQHRQQREQDRDCRKKGDNTAHTADQPVDDQCTEHGIDVYIA